MLLQNRAFVYRQSGRLYYRITISYLQKFFFSFTFSTEIHSIQITARLFFACLEFFGKHFNHSIPTPSFIKSPNRLQQIIPIIPKILFLTRLSTIATRGHLYMAPDPPSRAYIGSCLTLFCSVPVSPLIGKEKKMNFLGAHFL